MASAGLLHPQVDVNYNEEMGRKIKAGQYRPTPNDQVLDPMEIISDVWPAGPPHRHLHVFVSLPRGECCIRLLALAQDI
jgi:hypothetical protein